MGDVSFAGVKGSFSGGENTQVRLDVKNFAEAYGLYAKGLIDFKTIFSMAIDCLMAFITRKDVALGAQTNCGKVASFVANSFDKCNACDISSLIPLASFLIKEINADDKNKLVSAICSGLSECNSSGQENNSLVSFANSVISALDESQDAGTRLQLDAAIAATISAGIKNKNCEYRKFFDTIRNEISVFEKNGLSCEKINTLLTNVMKFCQDDAGGASNESQEIDNLKAEIVVEYRRLCVENAVMLAEEFIAENDTEIATTLKELKDQLQEMAPGDPMLNDTGLKDVENVVEIMELNNCLKAIARSGLSVSEEEWDKIHSTITDLEQKIGAGTKEIFDHIIRRVSEVCVNAYGMQIPQAQINEFRTKTTSVIKMISSGRCKFSDAKSAMDVLRSVIEEFDANSKSSLKSYLREAIPDWERFSGELTSLGFNATNANSTIASMKKIIEMDSSSSDFASCVYTCVHDNLRVLDIGEIDDERHDKLYRLKFPTTIREVAYDYVYMVTDSQLNFDHLVEDIACSGGKIEKLLRENNPQIRSASCSSCVIESRNRNLESLTINTISRPFLHGLPDIIFRDKSCRTIELDELASQAEGLLANYICFPDSVQSVIVDGSLNALLSTSTGNFYGDDRMGEFTVEMRNFSEEPPRLPKRFAASAKSGCPWAKP
ncbi:MAG: hypothetical protein LBD72_02645 [Puniceicoccales bacterium]|jgi:hypothetical protein|nr:hypothetical protein [Puniceicoccales bacterium]